VKSHVSLVVSFVLILVSIPLVQWGLSFWTMANSLHECFFHADHTREGLIDRQDDYALHFDSSNFVNGSKSSKCH
jgi:hypothetical protein